MLKVIDRLCSIMVLNVDTALIYFSVPWHG
jgi:hypothetical protein